MTLTPDTQESIPTGPHEYIKVDGWKFNTQELLRREIERIVQDRIRNHISSMIVALLLGSGTKIIGDTQGRNVTIDLSYIEEYKRITGIRIFWK